MVYYTYMKSLRLQKPHLLVVVGVPGSGKTFFASQFAKTFAMPYIHYQDIQQTANPVLDEQTTAAYAGLLFRELAKTEQSILIEGPGASRVERTGLAQQARAVGYVPLFIWVQTEPAAAHTRATKGVRGSSNVIISDDDFDAEFKRFTALHESEKSIVISGKHTYATQAKAVLQRLVEPAVQARRATTPSTPARPSQASGRITVQ